MTGQRPTRTAIVTGAASGIGRATAERLLADGWRVIGIDLAEAMPEAVTSVVGDATSPEVIERALAAVDLSLDGLVCAAGVPPSGPWDDAAHWSNVLRVDLTGPFEALRLSMPALSAANGSAVIIGSIVGPAEGYPGQGNYAAAKAGLGGLVKSMALIGAPLGVRVNLVEPGAIDTPFDPPRYPPDARPDVPLGRMGTAAEVAGAIVFLLGPDATYITGASLRIDGGRTLL